MKNQPILSIKSFNSNVHRKNLKNFSLVKLNLYYVMLFLLFMASCSNESILPESNTDSVSTSEMEMFSRILDKNYIQNASLKEKLVYKDHYLTSLMEAVIEVNPGFENNAVFKTSKKENPEVYIEGLLKISSQKTEKSESTLKKGIESLNAFTDLEGEKWYPVLKRLRKGGDSSSKEAIYLLKSYNENSKEEFVKAYQLKKNGIFKLIHDDFTEEMFLNSSKSGKAEPSVYSVTLQRCPPVDDPKQKAAYVDCSSGGGGGSGGTPSSVLNIEKIRINDKKESWIEKAEICFTGAKISFNGEQFERDWYISGSGSFSHLAGTIETITKISLMELGDKQTVNFKIGAVRDNSSFVFSIYEWDAWPAPNRYVKLGVIPGSCYCRRSGITTLKYRSYQTPYFDRVFSLNHNYLTDGVYSAFGKSFLSIEDNLSGWIEFND